MIKQFFGDWKRFLWIVIGNILLGIGIGIFKYSNMGNDPFSAMVLSLHAYTPWAYGLFFIVFSSSLFLIEVVLGRKYIGIGTLINWFLLGYIVQLTIYLLENNMPVLESIPPRLLAVAIGVVLAGLGLSIYQTMDAGVSPYDSLSLIAADRTPIPYFWNRIFLDAVCVVVAYLTGGLIGLGTLVCAFGLGPVVNFFNKKVSCRIIGSES